MTPAPNPDQRSKTDIPSAVKTANDLAREGYGWEDIAVRCGVSKIMAKMIVMRGK